MAIQTQRTRFEHMEFAKAAKAGFDDPNFVVNFVNISTEIIESDEGIWLVVTQEGNAVTGDEPLLPDYERVA